MRVAVLTVSDRAFTGEYSDETGPAVVRIVESWKASASVVARAVVADDVDAIAGQIVNWADGDGIDVILTAGGTGLGPRDVTPEATASVLDREIPGLGELMRSRGAQSTPLAALSRQSAGLRGQCLVVNLPGSPKGARESLEAIAEVLPHAVAMARGADHSQDSGR